MDKTITGKEPAAPVKKDGYSMDDGPVETSCEGLNIEQYLMAHAKPPKIIFEPIIRKSYVRDHQAGIWNIPDFGTPEYRDMIEQLTQADALYRTAFAKKAIISYNDSREGGR